MKQLGCSCNGLGEAGITMTLADITAAKSVAMQNGWTDIAADLDEAWIDYNKETPFLLRFVMAGNRDEISAWVDKIKAHEKSRYTSPYTKKLAIGGAGLAVIGGGIYYFIKKKSRKK